MQTHLGMDTVSIHQREQAEIPVATGQQGSTKLYPSGSGRSAPISQPLRGIRIRSGPGETVASYSTPPDRMCANSADPLQLSRSTAAPGGPTRTEHRVFERSSAALGGPPRKVLKVSERSTATLSRPQLKGKWPYGKSRHSKGWFALQQPPIKFRSTMLPSHREVADPARLGASVQLEERSRTPLGSSGRYLPSPHSLNYHCLPIL